MRTVADVLDELTIENMELAESQPDNTVRCLACAHRCLIHEDRRGICQVRFNRGGKLHVPWGYVAGLQADPIEKKPFFHILPGSDALTFGMLGCDFHCANCQNWVSSQTLRDPAANESAEYIRRITPLQIVLAAKRSGASVIASSYNEPLITSEWAVSIFKLAVEQGIRCVYVSNGNATPQVLEFLRPYLVGYKIDLKTMRDKQYRKLGGVLNNVLDTIRMAHKLGLWVEVVTLVIPGFNDSTEELLEAGRFITSVSPDIPWHVTAFHPDYKMTEPHPTPVKTLQRAAEIGQEAGLKFVYAGNLPASLREYENTHCPKCQALLVERTGYVIYKYLLTVTGSCPKCGTNIPGIWTDKPETVRLGGWGVPRLFR
ncbi:MAG: AmmeMemoRadiSam system radical SAM enzyme [Chloroflexi bacterium RBG_13_50_21]|nr:MAG: AmmeMemoRadiSam system radical SAM enzyme [Chloroflexi bacterium RBG_13_50_21]OGO63209.1 MAG: AmmeMemoRadiSam system radical SAM enzyme [Chloroflexi bacterium RBG_19FT_COMBO_50_10]